MQPVQQALVLNGYNIIPLVSYVPHNKASKTLLQPIIKYLYKKIGCRSIISKVYPKTGSSGVFSNLASIHFLLNQIKFLPFPNPLAFTPSTTLY